MSNERERLDVMAVVCDAVARRLPGELRASLDGATELASLPIDSLEWFLLLEELGGSLRVPFASSFERVPEPRVLAELVAFARVLLRERERRERERREREDGDDGAA